jgi:hypothetical protein
MRSCIFIEGHLAAITGSLRNIQQLDDVNNLCVAIHHKDDEENCQLITTNELIDEIYSLRVDCYTLQKVLEQLRIDYSAFRLHHNNILVKYSQRSKLLREYQEKELKND